ncbi:hypothetical protein MKX07_000006 [Trichoderma sp. CBMAI-0711]|uniref:Predicted protein n=3 Tax=Trichoderma TaxID=5543 RepID=G0RJU2_HYPJQ|nr:uncharacterized protein TRIREDRAFT_61526 [Trichoderma reesei QM6a]EGR48812.1 predicted protein [Trichoderma reesei QM6a]ETS01625.1 hypothetical protein M419DRAFT_130653 [Trichoderma reesei RUT C-30]KAK1242020.1 hypothetical protein MKX07_000006 [Trichoderma sp. CBMAI-0711]OTA03373.1 hypothetical protein A9Z42_0038330 [Trichoderma parareesei]
MLFKAAAFSSLLAVASARIAGIAVPETVAPGSTIKGLILTENYIQTVYDVAVAWGFAHGEGYPQSLGQVLDSSYLGPNLSNTVNNITQYLTIPASAEKGEALISASVFSLYGAVYGPTLTNFNVSITVGDSTSSTYKSSTF